MQGEGKDIRRLIDASSSSGDAVYEKANAELTWHCGRLTGAEICFSQAPISPVTSLSALGIPQLQTLPLTLVKATAPTAPTPAPAPFTSSTPAISQVCRLTPASWLRRHSAYRPGETTVAVT